MTTNRSASNWAGPLLVGVVLTLAAQVALQALWTPRPALAQVPDSGAQRNEMIQEQRVTNQKLTEIAALLREIRDRQPEARREAAPPRKP